MSDFVGMIFILFVFYVGVAYGWFLGHGFRWTIYEGRIAFRRPANPPGLASK